MSIADRLGIKVQLVESPEEILNLDWELDSHGYWWMRVVGSNGHEATLFVQPRPDYCDRGHWQVVCDYYRNDVGIDTIDGADFFPRMYMSLETAKREIREWIAWRMFKYSKHVAELVAHNSSRMEEIEKIYQKV